MLATIFVTGAVIFIPWYFISPATADAFVLYTAKVNPEGGVYYLSSTYAVCIILGSLGWVGFIVVGSLVCIWKDHFWPALSNLVKDNWQKATIKATKGVLYGKRIAQQSK